MTIEELITKLKESDGKVDIDGYIYDVDYYLLEYINNAEVVNVYYEAKLKGN